MAGERIQREQDDVGQHDERAEPHSESTLPVKESQVNVVPEEDEEDDREIEEVAVDVLQDERERRLTFIALVTAIIDRAGGRIQKERPIVSLAVVVAGGAESARRAQDQQRGRKLPPVMLRVNEWGIKRREIRDAKIPALVVSSFERAKGGVDAEAAQDDDDRQYLSPPGVAPLGRAESV